jgi:hypothetical protein
VVYRAKSCRFPAEPPQGGVHQGLTAENENAADMVNHAISAAKELKKVNYRLSAASRVKL